MKVSVGNDTNNLTKYDKIQIIDITEIKSPNTGTNLLQKLKTQVNDPNINGNIHNFVGSTGTNSSTTNSGATVLPPIGNSFMFIETSSANHGNGVFVSFERTDIIQISNITFY